MSNKIDGWGQRPVQLDGGARVARPGPAAAPGRETAGASDTDRVTLTESAQALQRLAEAIAAAPDVDQVRVAALKAAIARGDYRVDASRVADRMIALERELTGR